MRKLEKLTIKRFKSIREQTFQLGSLNVLIGANGVGKSNFVEVFRFLREIVGQHLAEYTVRKGGADNLLYYGRRESQEMEFFLEFGEGTSSNSYRVVLRATDDDSLFIHREIAYFHDKLRYPDKPYDKPVAFDERESKLGNVNHICTKQVFADLQSYRVYHFHDTSDSSPLKSPAALEDNRYLREQGSNLAAFLYLLQEKYPDHFNIIVQTIRQIAPFFEQFRLAPLELNESKIRLEWKERGSDAYFGPQALSDGTLRFICLATLLLQPRLPAIVLLDEPELGLHPAAITLLASLLSSAAERTQVIIATQSVNLVNQFTPEVVWIVDRREGQSVFTHLSEASMEGWLDDYALGELWEKNLLGGRP